MGCCGGIRQELTEADYAVAMSTLEGDGLFREVAFASCDPFEGLSQWREDWVNCFVYFDGNHVDPRTVKNAKQSQKTIELFVFDSTGRTVELKEDGQPDTMLLDADHEVRIFVPAMYLVCEQCFNKAQKRQWWVV